jgi:hypothetical protein
MNDTLPQQTECFCTNDCCRAGRPRIKVPSMMCSPFEILERYRNADFEGFFVSPCGNIFCSRACWAQYCED